MSPEKQRIAIAKACGWNPFLGKTDKGYPLIMSPPNQKNTWANSVTIPNYIFDLNAMHEAEKSLGPADSYRFADHLKVVVGRDAKEHFRDYILCEWFSMTWLAAHATAAQRAEAFLRTLNRWEEE